MFAIAVTENDIC